MMLPNFAFTIYPDFNATTFDQTAMEFTPESNTEDYDSIGLIFSILSFYLIVLGVCISIIYCHHRPGHDVEAGMSDPETDGWYVHVAHNESLPQYEDEIFDAPPTYDEAIYYTWYHSTEISCPQIYTTANHGSAPHQQSHLNQSLKNPLTLPTVYKSHPNSISFSPKRRTVQTNLAAFTLPPPQISNLKIHQQAQKQNNRHVQTHIPDPIFSFSHALINIYILGCLVTNHLMALQTAPQEDPITTSERPNITLADALTTPTGLVRARKHLDDIDGVDEQ
ncbi:hypothetical protein HBH56_138380 [Parastagonospora nodorum]|uniref:Uncharacterized protein n=1 Tax=Phaeosphaeria nodorum (strain SN15 / ATCC MYA-4574 / FGSC 10173) TaxID=321614 RepID=A0A7U2ERM7_PHANO|nr:hypothetical protein HBH56_138380 [Parastagonospora nodorum]QRC91402.1 hypothetical protein JI435_426860 [Parastagonospora nodorum SN15]KAH3928168.1 hypothetical protein HBH54_143520 [Parastagonospora nodorum]KAH3948879.1 hypothetical protein HBH53_093520 [Parastagonospora nodorum]KAH4005677.1 hypothetical protein HBI10_036050 [Parastagonospora nodorum]